MSNLEDQSASSSTANKRQEIVRLVASDGEIIEMDIAAAQLSGLLSEIIESSGTEDNIPITRVRGPTLKKVAEFCEMHKSQRPPEIEKPLRSVNLAELVPVEDFAYVESLDKEGIFEVLLAANFMNIQPLTELMGAKIASMIKNKTVEQLRETFGIQNDFTPEQEAQIREENRWCEDV